MSRQAESVDTQSKLVRSAISKTIENEIKSKNYKIRIESASQSGFVGIVHRIYYGTDEENGVNSKSSSKSLILKVTSKNQRHRDVFCSRPCFLREIFMYDELLPYYRAFEQSKGINVDKNGFNEYPKCYQTGSADPDEYLLLEDLCIRGFKVVDRHQDEFTVDHVRLYLQALGKYHAVSFALKDQQPEKFQELATNLNEIFLHGNSNIRGHLEVQKKSALNAVDNDEDADLLAKLKKVFEKDVLDVAVDLIHSEWTETATVISFGDANPNNCMFKYDENRKPIGICLIDWQLARVSSPIIDVVYFIFLSTTKELRDIHYDNLLKVYHDSLSAHIRRLGSNPDKIFTEEARHKHLRRFGKFGLIVALWMLAATTAESSSKLKFEETCEKLQDAKQSDDNPFISDRSIERFNSRIRGVIADMVRLGYI